jgi:Protein of unknown function (DUF3036).
MDTEIPRPSTGLAIVTHVLLALLLVVGLGAIVALPSISASVAESFPEYAGLRAPLLTVSLALAGLGLVVIALVSLLVHRVWRGSVLSRSSVRWVDLIVVALALAIVLIVVGFVLISAAHAGSPFVALVAVMGLLGFATLTSIMLVLRSLLRRATLLSEELDVVV